MKFTVAAVAVAVAVLAAAGSALGRPDDTVLDFEADDHKHVQRGETGKSVEGEYSWTSPEGETYYVKYIADHNGFRIIDSNAVPISHSGVKADGQQGASGDEEHQDESTKH